MNVRRDKTADLGAIKVQLPFLEGKCQFIIRGINSVPYNFLSVEFSATTSEQIK